MSEFLSLVELGMYAMIISIIGMCIITKAFHAWLLPTRCFKCNEELEKNAKK